MTFQPKSSSSCISDCKTHTHTHKHAHRHTHSYFTTVTLKHCSCFFHRVQHFNFHPPSDLLRRTLHEFKARAISSVTLLPLLLGLLGLVRMQILTCMNFIHTSFCTVTLACFCSIKVVTRNRSNWSFSVCYTFSSCLAFWKRRKCSDGSVFPGKPGRADDPLRQAGEQEGDRLFVHVQGRAGRAAARGGHFSCQGGERKRWRKQK